MKKQVMIIGLGQFGMSLTRSLSERGVEILAIDRKNELVRIASEFVTEALCFNATDEAALAQIAPERRDICIVAIGDDSREASIICTALLRQMGAKRIIGRANDALHERILYLVGAHEVVNPERDFGERFANRVVYEGLMGELRLGKDLVLTEMQVPSSFVGKTLLELKLPKRFGITVVAVRTEGESGIQTPQPNEVLKEKDIVVVVSKMDSVKKLLERIAV